MTNSFDVIIVGAGAAGMFCAATAGQRGQSVLIVDHSETVGEKIRISGGGRCNFTNLNTDHRAFLSQNKHFAKSALSQYTQHDFIALVDRYGIDWHDKGLGQLFCDGKSSQIIDLLLSEMSEASVELRMQTVATDIAKVDDHFELRLNGQKTQCKSLVIATGGKSIPKIGATGFGYQVAEQFDLNIIETRPALVPLTFEKKLLEETSKLSGISTDARITCNGISFDEALLFTHRGLSGPSILQISSYWREGDEIVISLLPDTDVLALLKQARNDQGKKAISTIIAELLPARLADFLVTNQQWDGTIGDQSNADLEAIAAINHWNIKPAGSEGYRTAEVTLGGVDTNHLSSKTMECKSVPGLYFIGEVVDVTGWLGGYNFQWAWSSAWVAGQSMN
ncbi:MAG: aminoacetone oxidase family FAD-binding enzyme [Hyphomicrobiales bacterium]|nr:MAG: aminoacetone oxidase family FAD-binding enzyme [Hyphomicrobiales bacterium]